MIMDAGTSEIAGHANLLEILAKVDVAVLSPKAVEKQKSRFLGDLGLLRPSTDWMRCIHIMVLICFTQTIFI